MAIITIRQWHQKVISSHASILESALENGVPFPHGCLSGRCGQCKARLTRGNVEHTPYYKQALSAEELADGLILPCCARARSDIEIAWTNPVDLVKSLPPQRYCATVTSIVPASHNVSCLRLAPTDGKVEFFAGQYARLQFSTLQTRAYSFANRPDEPQLEFHVRKVPGGLASNYVSDHLAIGDTVHIDAPYGVSQLRENHTGRIIAFAGGTGLAPVMSIIRSALLKNHLRECHLYFSSKNSGNLYYTEELSQLAIQYQNLHVSTILSEPDCTSGYRTGPVYAVLVDDFANLNNTKIYAAGSPSMIAAMTKTALDCGVAAVDIHADVFTASAREDEVLLKRKLSEFLDLFKQRPD